jgi:predicted ATP-grasp superfamily ATP-dependent carboligase
VADALSFHVQPELHDAPLLLAFDGWNDAGQSATTAVRFVADALRAVPLAEIDCEDFFDFTVHRPTVRTDENRQRVIEWPVTAFSYSSIDGARELVLGAATEPHLRWRGYCDLVLRFLEQMKLRRVVILGAYLADVVYSRPVDVTGFASSSDLLDKVGVMPSGYEGPTGIVGVLTDRLLAQGYEVVSLWAGLPHYISSTPNPRGALALMQKVENLIDVKVDVEPLRRDAAAFEAKINDLVASDPELNDYVRELKRREFAQ